MGRPKKKIEKNEDFAYAAVIPDNITEGYDYLVATLTDVLSDPNNIVDICWRLYENEGVVGSAIDTLIDLAITKGTVENCKNEELLAILNFWMENLNNMYDEGILDKKTISAKAGMVNTDFGLLSLCENMLLHYFVSGDVVLLENWSNKVYVPSLNKACILPKNIILYDIRSIEIDPDASTIGVELLKLKVNNDLVSLIKSGGKDPRYKTIVDSLPKEIINKIKGGATTIDLPPILTTHFKRKGMGRPRGIPYMKRAFPDIAAKRRLQKLDETTIAGMIQRLTILSIGHKDPASPYHIPKQGRAAFLENKLKQIKTQKLLIWSGPDLDVIDIGPDGKILSFENRFKEADDGISLALGIPRILLDGASTGVGSKDWITVIKTVSILERLRATIKSRIDRWFRMIAIKNGMDEEFPTFRWSIMRLRDENVARTLILKAWEDNLVGREDTLNFLGFDGREIIERHIKEGEEKLNEQIPPSNPSFSSPKTNQIGRPDDMQDDENNPV